MSDASRLNLVLSPVSTTALGTPALGDEGFSLQHAFEYGTPTQSTPTVHEWKAPRGRKLQWSAAGEYTPCPVLLSVPCVNLPFPSELPRNNVPSPLTLPNVRDGKSKKPPTTASKKRSSKTPKQPSLIDSPSKSRMKEFAAPIQSPAGLSSTSFSMRPLGNLTSSHGTKSKPTKPAPAHDSRGVIISGPDIDLHQTSSFASPVTNRAKDVNRLRNRWQGKAGMTYPCLPCSAANCSFAELDDMAAGTSALRASTAKANDTTKSAQASPARPSNNPPVPIIEGLSSRATHRNTSKASTRNPSARPTDRLPEDDSVIQRSRKAQLPIHSTSAPLTGSSSYRKEQFSEEESDDDPGSVLSADVQVLGHDLDGPGTTAPTHSSLNPAWLSQSLDRSGASRPSSQHSQREAETSKEEAPAPRSSRNAHATTAAKHTATTQQEKPAESQQYKPLVGRVRPSTRAGVNLSTLQIFSGEMEEQLVRPQPSPTTVTTRSDTRGRTARTRATTARTTAQVSVTAMVEAEKSAIRHSIENRRLNTQRPSSPPIDFDASVSQAVNNSAIATSWQGGFAADVPPVSIPAAASSALPAASPSEDAMNSLLVESTGPQRRQVAKQVWGSEGEGGAGSSRQWKDHEPATHRTGTAPTPAFPAVREDFPLTPSTAMPSSRAMTLRNTAASTTRRNLVSRGGRSLHTSGGFSTTSLGLTGKTSGLVTPAPSVDTLPVVDLPGMFCCICLVPVVASPQIHCPCNVLCCHRNPHSSGIPSI